MSWRSVVIVLLLLGAGLSAWSLWSQRHQQAPDGPASGRPDYVLHDFELVVLDQQGHESFTLRAPLLARDPSDETIEIATPRFVIPPKPGSGDQPWRVKSRTGWVSATGDELRLRGDVRANSEDAGGQPIRIATEQLNIFPETRRATSAVPVTVNQPGFTMNGTGLEALLGADRIFLNNVQARYENTVR